MAISTIALCVMGLAAGWMVYDVRSAKFSMICFHGSKSFFAASLLYPPWIRRQVFILYAFARMSDDLIDECAPEEQSGNLELLFGSLNFVYGRSDVLRTPTNDSEMFIEVIDAMKELINERKIPEWVIGLLIEGYYRDTDY